MTEYEFEIQTSTTIRVAADNAEDARMIVINKMEAGEYDIELAPNAGTYISDGREIKG